MTLFHFHKWGPIKGEYQQCLKCGIVRILPCKHKWKHVGSIRPNWGFFDSVDILECTKCGDRKEARYPVL